MRHRFVIMVLGICMAAAAVVADAPSTGAAEPVKSAISDATAATKTVETKPATDYVKWIAMVTVLSLAPALAITVTAFVRIVVVLGIFRHGLGSQQLPPNQVVFALALLMSMVVMAPMAKDIFTNAYKPLEAGEIDTDQAISRGESKVRGFMISQIEATDNSDAVYPFLDEQLAKKSDLAWRDVPTLSLIPGFVVSELKVAFAIGLKIFLPFLIIDLLVAVILVSAGMFMVPPTLVSLPLKLLLFVLADGWVLMTGSLIGSFA